MVKKINLKFIILFVLLSCITPLFADGETSLVDTEEVIESYIDGPDDPDSSFFSWLENWRLLGILLMAISIIFVAFAYMISKSLNIFPVKMWADLELGQVFVSAIILIGLIAILSIIDVTVTNPVIEQMLGIGGGAEGGLSDYLTSGEPGHISVAKGYLNDLKQIAIKMGKGVGKGNLDSSWESTKRDGHTVSIYGIFYFGTSYTPNAGMTILNESNNTLLSYIGNIIASLEAQRYFMEMIGNSLGPMLIISGILLRSFFLTRRLGGLLLSIGIGLMVIYPLTYILSTFGLGLQAYGAEAMSTQPSNCPAECLLKLPLGYNNSNTSQTFTDYTDIYSLLPEGTSVGEADEEEWEAVGITLCAPQCGECVGDCRVYPNHPSLECVCPEEDCKECPPQCKIFRNRTDCDDPANEFYCSPTECPEDCKADFNPLMTDDCIDCIGCPGHCRYVYNETGNLIDWLDCEVYTDECTDCSCKIGIPESSANCEDMCDGCPYNCRIGAVDSDIGCSDCSADCLALCSVDDIGDDTCDSGVYKRGSTVEPEYTNCSKCPIPCRTDFDELVEGILVSHSSNFMTLTSCEEYPLQKFCNGGFCEDSFHITETPLFCVEFGTLGSDEPDIACNQVPENCRIKINDETPALVECEDIGTECEDDCIEFVTLPTTDESGDALDCSECGSCPDNCRIISGGVLSSTCTDDDICSTCPAACKVSLPDPIICNVFDSDAGDWTGCTGCPEPYRLITDEIITDYPTERCNPTNCPDECKVNITDDDIGDNYDGVSDCFGCPLECRISNPSNIEDLPEYCSAFSDVCDEPDCPESCQLQSFETKCIGCTDCHPDCTRTPQFRTDCNDVCNDDLEGAVDLTGAGIYYALGGSEDMGEFGAPSQILVSSRNIGILLLPAYVLPLLNILITISFIIILSKHLGGDYEIPGLSKFI